MKQGLSDTYKATGNLKSKNFPSGGESENTFLCRPGAFTQLGSFVECSRDIKPSSNFAPCEGETLCQSFHLNMNSLKCESKCVSLDWAVESFDVLNFKDNYPMFEVGSSCGTDNTDFNSSSDSDSGSLVAAVVIGWILVAILLGIIIAYIVYRKRKSEQTSSKPAPVRSESLPNSYEGPHTGNPQGRGVRGLDIIHPLPAEGDGITGYDSCTPDGDPSADYTVIEEGRVMSTPQQTKRLDQIKAMLKKRPLPGTEDGASTSAKKGSDASVSGWDGYYLAKPGQEDEPSDTETGYIKLEREEHAQDGQSSDNAYSKQSASSTSEEKPGESKASQSVRTGDYAQLNGGATGHTGHVHQKKNPDGYNMPSMLFEDRENKGGNYTSAQNVSPYDVPRG